MSETPVPPSLPPAPGRTGTGSASPRSRRPRRADDGRLVRGRRSRARIREAARELFRERGFDGATLRAIAARAGMGASSIYRHVRCKEELLVQELAELQEEAWRRFRIEERNLPRRPTRERLQRFLELQHELLEGDRDLTTIALRATTRPEARVARHVLRLHDRTVALLVEILQQGRMRGDLRKDLDVLTAAQAIFHLGQGVRIPWANGALSSGACRRAIAASVDLLFTGIAAAAAAPA